MKRLIGKMLMKLTEKFIIASPASAYSVGIEDMPESMKKMR
ncbi:MULTISPECIES: hypothetical protein [unclassified Clostridium]|uniref:Cyclic lactone autoinducer peptide n=1 Tax=Clostridium botulinum (strain Eklund 17B / Type B) TaxID=935198 RepID=B2TL92_CLOBB|nr:MULTISPECIES: hypothetical protein [unclassified Clostridium]ACD24259.1 conserved hypothetical protein [Clostridium botulinum B str. Eklund 17B (NRP)]CDH89662.1 hypothetical protein CB17B0672 [Clostridium botulinum B str. Eklund 17B (NRP)]